MKEKRDYDTTNRPRNTKRKRFHGLPEGIDPKHYAIWGEPFAIGTVTKKGDPKTDGGAFN